MCIHGKPEAQRAAAKIPQGTEQSSINTITEIHWSGIAWKEEMGWWWVKWMLKGKSTELSPDVADLDMGCYRLMHWDFDLCLTLLPAWTDAMLELYYLFKCTRTVQVCYYQHRLKARVFGSTYFTADNWSLLWELVFLHWVVNINEYHKSNNDNTQRQI